RARGAWSEEGRTRGARACAAGRARRGMHNKTVQASPRACVPRPLGRRKSARAASRRRRRRNRRRRRRRRSNGKWKNVPMPRSVRHSGEPALARPEATGGGRPEAARPNPARGAGGDHEFASVQRQRGTGWSLAGAARRPGVLDSSPSSPSGPGAPAQERRQGGPGLASPDAGPKALNLAAQECSEFRCTKTEKQRVGRW
ncbi:unnamed protein product, partial [Prorocentrum cordatum]